MNRSAIHDLLGGVMCGWYRSVAEWQPPGQLLSTTCTRCRSTILASTFDIAQWPHDLVHQLAMDLDDAAAAIHASLEEDRIHGRAGAGDVTVARQVADAFSAHLSDIADVLTQCVTPKIDAWVAAETQRTFSH